MGQSNMAGFGCIRADDPWQADDFDPVPGVLVLGGQAKLKDSKRRGSIRWRPASHPLHLNQRSAGFGLGLPFAVELRKETPGHSVGLIPCAWGGAPIQSLGPGSPSFQNTVRRARYAERFGVLRAVLWHQGETDALDPADSAAHADRLRGLMHAMRGELDQPDLPFLIGDLAEPTRPNIDHERVRQGLRAVAEEDRGSRFVEAAGLEKVDSVHFGRDALIEFGRRYAQAWRQR
ncbi:hypothetical protein HAHE_18080 [Haloferula helveola]|uniref:Sialate O-acetylesterase domain-containing protein n=2 Tax=Haloferula helveola TaxID=490095 RepID=A0ABN6H8V0_9BACT|nr:hypothetical protein HAHE_18080 [Haloferula helveola]